MTFETIPIETWPDDETKIWLNPYLFLNNWSTSLKVESRWMTDITVSTNNKETRVGLIDKPYRVLSASYASLSREACLHYQMMMARLSKARFWFPVYSDFSKLEVQANQTSTTTTTTKEPVYLYCDTTYRRFFAGRYIAVVKSYTEFDILKILSVSSDFLITTGTLSRDYQTGCKIFPLTVGEIISSESRNVITDTIGEGTLTAKEIVGKYSLPALADSNEVTSVYSFNGYPILDVRPDWRELSIGWSRNLETNEVGRGSLVETFGDRPLMNREASLTFLSRLSAYNFLRFFDSRRGRLWPFFILSDFNEYSDIYEISSDRKQISIERTGPGVDWIFRPYLGIRLKTGEFIVAKVASLNSTTTTQEAEIVLENVNLETALPAFDLSNVHRLHIAFFVRFASDELEESWITDEVMQTNILTTELEEAEFTSEILYFGTTTTTQEPTTTSSGIGGTVTGLVDQDPDLEVTDENILDPSGTWDGYRMEFTSGAAIGKSFYINSYVYFPPWFHSFSIANSYGQGIQVGDNFILTEEPRYPGIITDYSESPPDAYVTDTNHVEATGTWNNWFIEITSGGASGYMFQISTWNGPPSSTALVTDMAGWGAQINDTFNIRPYTLVLDTVPPE